MLENTGVIYRNTSYYLKLNILEEEFDTSTSQGSGMEEG
jgi:hypothetical protein